LVRVKVKVKAQEEKLNNLMKSKPKNLKEAFSYTGEVRGKTWAPSSGQTPFNVITGMGYLKDVLSGNIKKDEELAKAPKVLPFPLDRIVDQLAKTYEELMKTRSTLSTSIRTALLTGEEKKILRKDIEYVEKCIDYIKKMSADLERLYL